MNDVLVELRLLNLPRWGSGDDACPGSRWAAAVGRAGDTGTCHTRMCLSRGTALRGCSPKYPWECFIRGRGESQKNVEYVEAGGTHRDH